MNAETKAYKEKANAELRQIKEQLEELQARFEAQDLEAATDLINHLKSTHQKIEKRNEALQTTAVEEIQEEQAEIDAGIAKLRDGLTRLERKIGPEPRAKIG